MCNVNFLHFDASECDSGLGRTCWWSDSEVFMTKYMAYGNHTITIKRKPRMINPQIRNGSWFSDIFCLKKHFFMNLI